MKTQRKFIAGKFQVLAKKTSVEAATEADVFRIMGLENRGPTERNAYDAVASAAMETPGDEMENGVDVEELSQPVHGQPEWPRAREGEEGGEAEMEEEARSEGSSGGGDRWDLENPTP